MKQKINYLSEKENCNYIKSLNNIKSSKEYELNKLNENIKNNLKDINDFLIFQNNNKLNYIFLCQIRVNEDFLKEVNISKKINFIAKNIELDFINKYSKQYNAKKFTSNLTAVSIGDINGIGIQILIKAWKNKKLKNFILITNYELFNKYIIKKKFL